MPFTDTLHPYFQERERQNHYSGVVLITQGGKEQFSAAYGYASRAWQVPNTLDIRFDTASITKIFTTVATLQLIEQGLLRFDTSAIDYLGLTDTTISPAVTVHHLMTHTSGIADDADEEAGEDYEDLWRDKPNYSVMTTADFLPQFIHKPANFAPGEGCRYCNVGFVLLGLMIEKATGLSYRDTIRQHIFERAGMRHCDFYRMDRANENVAEGCDLLEDGTWKRNIYSYPPIGSPDGGAHVTAGDMDIFLHAIRANTLLSPEMTQTLLTPQALHHDNEREFMRQGYGLEFFTMKANGLTFYQKEGINAGVSGIIRHYPAPDLNVILLSNMMDGVWEPINHIHEQIMNSVA